MKPSDSVKSFKRTKIIASLGPSTNTYESILGLVKSGADGLVLDFSYGTYDDKKQQIKWIREASKERAKLLSIIAELEGPKVRLGEFDGFVNVTRGQSVQLAYLANYPITGHLPIKYDLSSRVKRGEHLYLYEGKVRLEVSAVRDGVIYAEAQNDGILIAGKTINLPDSDLAGDVITQKDRADMAFISTEDIDFVAQGFIQTGDDVASMHTLMNQLGCKAKLIAKFETKASIEHMEEIIEEADCSLVARDALAVELSPEQIPAIQNRLINLSIAKSKPVIIPVKVLSSTTEARSPTHIEASVVASAVVARVDAVMLGDETASGRNPLEAVKITRKVIRYSELGFAFKINVDETKTSQSNQAAIGRAIVSLAEDVKAAAIVAETRSGATALQIANRRSRVALIAVTSDPRTAQQLALVYGVRSYVRTLDLVATTKLAKWLVSNKILSSGDVIVTASSQKPGVVGTTDTIKVRVLE
jgi:pyruvate kinase